MTRQLFSLTVFLALTVSFTSCNGQVKTDLPKDSVNEPKKNLVGQPTLVKTQGTNEYANIGRGLLDKDGNLWFGTSGEGVYRYDGKLFTQFTVKDGLSNNIVMSITEDKDGNIWFGTADGACYYNGKVFTNIPITAITGDNSYRKTTIDSYGKAYPEENAVLNILQDKTGKFWFGTRDGVYCSDGKSLFPGQISSTRFLDNEAVINKEGLHLKGIGRMLEDKNGNIWFCTGGRGDGEGICRYDGKSITRYKPNGDSWVRNIIETKDGNIYIATRQNGVCRYDSTSGEFINFTEKAGINNSSVTTILEDKAGNIWIGTELGSGQLGEDGGVWRFNGKTFNKFTTKEGLIHNGVFTIVEDKLGNIWFGTRNIGLCSYNGKTFTVFSERPVPFSVD